MKKALLFTGLFITLGALSAWADGGSSRVTVSSESGSIPVEDGQLSVQSDIASGPTPGSASFPGLNTRHESTGIVGYASAGDSAAKDSKDKKEDEDEEA